MSDDPFAPYRIDAPLAEEEQALSEILRSREGGDRCLEVLAAVAVQVRPDASDLSNASKTEVLRVAVEKVIRETLLPLAHDEFHEGRIEIGLGATAMALRLALAVLDPRHELTLYSVHGLALCLHVGLSRIDARRTMRCV